MAQEDIWCRITSLIRVIVYAPLGEMIMLNWLQSFKDFFWGLMSKHEIWFTPFNDFSNFKHMVNFFNQSYLLIGLKTKTWTVINCSIKTFCTIKKKKSILISSDTGNHDKRYPLKLVFITLKGRILPLFIEGFLFRVTN